MKYKRKQSVDKNGHLRPSVVFAPSGDGGGRRVKMSFVNEHRTRGFAPVGVEAMLDATKMNNASLWLNSQSLSSFGVLVPRSKATTNLIESRIELLSGHYPINNSRHAMGVATHETTTIRGFHILGDDEDIANLWANLYSYDCSIRGWDVPANAMCWTAMAPTTVYVPYLDLDERDEDGQFHRVWETRVRPTVALIHKALSSRVEGVKTTIFFNCRPDGKLFKYSFHIHWPQIGVDNIMHWKNFLLQLSDLPRKLIWTLKEGKWDVQEDVKKPIFDPAVYSGRRQLFRGPFCGKTGKLDAVMLPCVLQKVDGIFKFQKNEYSKADMITHILSARIARTACGLTMLEFAPPVPVTIKPMAIPVERDAAEDVTLPPPEEDRECPVARFATPFFVHNILPKWQLRRHKDLMSVQAGGATVPTNKLTLGKNTNGRRAGERFYSVVGDTFCEMDDAHVHSRSRDVIGIVVNYFKCTIRQSCFACGKHGTEYFFLHSKGRVEISTAAESSFTSVNFWGRCATPHQTLLDYYRDLFVQQRVTRSLWVYDKDCCVWRTDIAGNMVAGNLIDELNELHLAYLKKYKNSIVSKQMAAIDQKFPFEQRDSPERKAAVEKVLKGARKFMSENTPFLYVTPTSRGKFIDELKGYRIFNEIAEMNPYDNLIPMKNKKCINVFTGEINDMEKQHFFTSCVNAEITTEEADIDIINKLFAEISTGDKEKCTYMKMISGYCFTFLVHDRKFYVLIGGGHNAKGLMKQFIMNISKGPEGFDSRAKNLQQSFWSDRANANQGSEQATPEGYELQNKTFLYTDDIASIPTDNNKLKRCVGGEETSGRSLYGKPVDIKVRGKIMWTTNPDVAGPGEDIAYWERISIIPMLTKYVETGPIDPLNFRFRKNHAVYLSLLEKLDAFFTVTVTALIQYYQSLEWDPINKRPVNLNSFPLPKSVAKKVAETRAQRFPLAAFIRDHTAKTKVESEGVSLSDLFSNYMNYLENMNEMKMKRDTTQSKFEQLMSTSMDMPCTNCVFTNLKLTRPVIKRRQDEDVRLHEPVAPLHHAPDGYYIDKVLERLPGQI